MMNGLQMKKRSGGLLAYWSILLQFLMPKRSLTPWSCIVFLTSVSFAECQIDGHLTWSSKILVTYKWNIHVFVYFFLSTML